MERHKRVGILTMAIAMVFAFASVVFSENACYPGSPADESLVRLLLVRLRINVYEEIPGNEYGDHIYLPLKYLLLASVATFTLGMLWHKAVLPLPSGRAKSASSEDENS